MVSYRKNCLLLKILPLICCKSGVFLQAEASIYIDAETFQNIIIGYYNYDCGDEFYYKDFETKDELQKRNVCERDAETFLTKYGENSSQFDILESALDNSETALFLLQINNRIIDAIITFAGLLVSVDENSFDNYKKQFANALYDGKYNVCLTVTNNYTFDFLFAGKTFVSQATSWSAWENAGYISRYQKNQYGFISEKTLFKRISPLKKYSLEKNESGEWRIPSNEN